MTLSVQVEAALAQVGARLREVRARRGRTLTDVAGQTGISKSTLSRLESGQRRPSLELLLPLAEAYQVPLDDLVGAPAVGDPRVRLKPHSRHGRTVVPLSRQPGGVQAWKVVIPSTQVTPQLKSHEGYEWMYVLSGRLRLILDGNDVVLGVGEVAEFSTRLPHWFGSYGRRSGRGAVGVRPAGRAHAPARRTPAAVGASRDVATAAVLPSMMPPARPLVPQEQQQCWAAARGSSTVLAMSDTDPPGRSSTRSDLVVVTAGKPQFDGHEKSEQTMVNAQDGVHPPG